jgi:four helix bundle protein
VVRFGSLSFLPGWAPDSAPPQGAGGAIRPLLGGALQHFTDLRVWQRAHALALHVYRLTADFPAAERFGVSAQIRRAATSVAANIAEGSKRRTGADYARFLNIAEGSTAEVQYLLILSRDLGYVGAAQAQPVLYDASEILKMLYNLRQKVEA